MQQKKACALPSLIPRLTNMVYIPRGTFTMGSPESETGRNSAEGVAKAGGDFWVPANSAFSSISHPPKHNESQEPS